MEMSTSSNSFAAIFVVVVVVVVVVAIFLGGSLHALCTFCKKVAKGTSPAFLHLGRERESM
jgi:hypothetical protein